MTLPRAVVTGFRPFGDVVENPSALLVESVASDDIFAGQARVRLETRLLDTVYGGLRGRIESVLASEPSALVMTGYSSLARGFKIETGATSRCHPGFADASGWHPPESREPVRAAANAAVDFAQMIDALHGAGIPARLSGDAGEYVCNAAYWHALDLIAAGALATRALFLHLPALDGMEDPPRGAGSLDLARMRRGLAIVLRVLSTG